MHSKQQSPKGIIFTLFAILLTAMFSGTPASRGQAPIHIEKEPGAVAVPEISLAEAIRRAQQNEPAFAASVGAAKNAAIDRALAKTAILPTVTYHNQVLYTQSNGSTNQGGQVGTQSSPIFIANNAVHEYASQASINETIGFRQLAEVKVASANALRATAETEVARRGLVAAVVALYYQAEAAETKQHLLDKALEEATAFTDLTKKREAVREIAHADVVKAELQQQQRQRDRNDALVTTEKARLELAVLLFPDPRTPYKTVEPSESVVLPTKDEVESLAAEKNPEIRSALAGLGAANAGVAAAKAAYLPDLSLGFNYGIDASEFALRGPERVPNLGYSIGGTLDIPVWDWFSTQKRVKQSQIQRDVAKVNLTAVQRRLIAVLEETYTEAATAHDQLQLLDESVLTAAENLRLTKLRYAAGESPALEVVDAQNSYLAAETAQTDGVVRFQTALAGLELLMGTR